MSSQAFISNASQSTLAAVGDGYSVPRMPTAQRLAIVFTTADVGMMVYDTTLNNLFIWNGTAWESIPASGDAGINGAVQYNDNGVVSGAASFVYNKVNQKVGIGTITPNVELDVVGSATITGDLTVRTNRLVATTTGVGIGTTTLFGDLNIQNGSNCRLEVTSQAGGTTIENLNNARNAYLNMTMFADAYIWNRLGSEAMRLNSTGLGVGGSPSRKLSVSGAGGGFDLTDTTQSTRIRMRSSSASNFYIEALNSAESAYVTLRLNDTTQIDASGNCGIGVAPSAWNSSYKAIQTQGGAVVSGTTGHLRLYQNGFQNASNQQIYINSLAASLYSQDAGSHIWFNAPSGTAGTAITFTPAMTLDASGRLIVNSSTFVPPTLNTNGELNFLATSNTNVRFSYRGTDGVTRVANITLA